MVWLTKMCGYINSKKNYEMVPLVFMLQNFFSNKLMIFCNKLECSTLANIFTLT